MINIRLRYLFMVAFLFGTWLIFEEMHYQAELVAEHIDNERYVEQNICLPIQDLTKVEDGREWQAWDCHRGENPKWLTK